MLPNLIGNKPDWDKLKRYLVEMGREDIFLIEDSADTLTKTPVIQMLQQQVFMPHTLLQLVECRWNGNV